MKLTQNGLILDNNGKEIGFIEDDKVHVFENGSSRPIGSFDHRSEIPSILEEWKNGNR